MMKNLEFSTIEALKCEMIAYFVLDIAPVILILLMVEGIIA